MGRTADVFLDLDQSGVSAKHAGEQSAAPSHHRGVVGPTSRRTGFSPRRLVNNACLLLPNTVETRLRPWTMIIEMPLNYEKLKLKVGDVKSTHLIGQLMWPLNRRP